MSARYQVQPSARRDGTFNVVDMRRVVAVKMGLTEAAANHEAAERNRGEAK